MSLDDTLKKVLGDEVFKEKGSELKKELAKEMIPKTEFNDKLETIKGLESEKRLLLEEKTQLEAEAKKKVEASLTDIQKLEKLIEETNKKVELSEKARIESEKLLNDEKETNSLRDKLIKNKLNPKNIDLVLPKFKGLKEDEFDTKWKEFSENHKELLGESQLNGEKPKGSMEDFSGDFLTKEQVDKMTDAQAAENYDKILKSMDKW